MTNSGIFSRRPCFLIPSCATSLLLVLNSATATVPRSGGQNRLVEWTIESDKRYADPFNDVDVDVIFSKNGEAWRVPMFWRGGGRWTVRFAPPERGEYAYRLESTDTSNPDLNGHGGHVIVGSYTGRNSLLQHGMLRVSAGHRYFEHADGTPFFWLGDTLWTGLSDRLSWRGFQTLIADRKAKGFTVLQICAGLVPNGEELAPVDPGFSNEGGSSWDSKFQRINPRYFDYADRRIQYLIGAGIAPAIVGGWRQVLRTMDSAKMKQHWRYIIARYGAYPVFWVVGGEIVDPPPDIVKRIPQSLRDILSPGWTEIARYVRSTDPYHHPLTAHESYPPFDSPLQDSTLTDFDLIQPTHWGWPSIGNEVVQLNERYSRTDQIKPVVVGEIGYEMIGGTHLEDFQRVAFWLAMLNGASGHTYGAAPTFEVNNPTEPLHRAGQYTFLTWREGMKLPGSYQVGLSSKLLRQYPWWQFAPHPEWVIPRGTTILESHSGPKTLIPNDVDFKSVFNADFTPTTDFLVRPETLVPTGEWQARQGTFRQPYAAGIPGKVRFIYLPFFGLLTPSPPTVLGLEVGVRYRAYYFEPMLGIKFDLGGVEVLPAGPVELREDFGSSSKGWSEQGTAKAQLEAGQLRAQGDTLSVTNQINTGDYVVAVDARSESSAGLVMRFHDAANYVAAIYSAQEKELYFSRRINGVDAEPIGAVKVAALARDLHLTAEVRDCLGAASVTDGKTKYSTPIVDIAGATACQPEPSNRDDTAVGLLHRDDGRTQEFSHFEVRRARLIREGEYLDRKLYDARGIYRGNLSGPGWEEFGRHHAILLDAYRPERLPSAQDWVLVLEAVTCHSTTCP